MTLRTTAFLVLAALLGVASLAAATDEIPAEAADTVFFGAAFDNLGHVVEVGDLNHDGHPDLVMSAPGD